MEIFVKSHHHIEGRHKLRGTGSRRCGFECLEPRQLLAADLLGSAVDVPLRITDGATGSINGSVFAAPTTASCDSHEAGTRLADVRVQLLDESGTVIRESTTDASGVYHFADLLLGQYAVRQISPNVPLRGAAHVGEGGGVAVDSNQVGGIVVQADKTLGGYDFCEFDIAAESAAQALQYLTLAIPATPTGQPEIYVEPAVESTERVTQMASAPLNMPRPAEIYGGSSRRPKGSDSLKTWEESPLDDYFSTASFLELATADLPTSEPLDSIVREPLLGEPLLSETADESHETPATEGATVEMLEWWEVDAHWELDALLDDEEIIDLEVEPTEAAVKIARLQDAY